MTWLFALLSLGDMSAEDWSDVDIEAIVASHLAMPIRTPEVSGIVQEMAAPETKCKTLSASFVKND